MPRLFRGGCVRLARLSVRVLCRSAKKKRAPVGARKFLEGEEGKPCVVPQWALALAAPMPVWERTY